MMVFGEWSLPISTHQPSLYFLSAVWLQRGVTKWLWWVSSTQTGSTFHNQATQDLGASLQLLRAGLYLEKAGVAVEGQSYHLSRDYMSAYATLCGGSRDILGEALWKKLCKCWLWHKTFSPHPDVLREAVVADTSKKQGGLLSQHSSKRKGWK